MFRTDLETDRKLRSELRKAENREKIALCKLERIKERFDRLYDDMASCQDELESGRVIQLELKEQVETAQAERNRAVQEALMWRTQLFERMEMLEDANLQLVAAEHELEAAWEKVGYATETHQVSHKELRKRDRERLAFQLKIDELEKAQKDAKEQNNDLLGALTGAETAIRSLQRSNDLYQREVDGLKSLGASLTEKLTRLTEERDRVMEELATARDEFDLELNHSKELRKELERAKDELYETKGKLVTFQLESDVKALRKTGQEKSAQKSGDKFSQFPAQESEVVTAASRNIFSRATKRMTGWFKLQDSQAPRRYVTIETKKPRKKK